MSGKFSKRSDRGKFITSAAARSATAGYARAELEALYAWIEANGFYDDAGGRRRGYLYPQDRLQQSWSDDEREGGTDIVFFTDEPKNRDEELRYWFYGEDRELAAEIKQRLCVFAGSGSEGSMCALWLDDAGEARPRTWAPARARS